MSESMHALGAARALSDQFGIPIEASQAQRFINALQTVVNAVATQAYQQGMKDARREGMTLVESNKQV